MITCGVLQISQQVLHQCLLQFIHWLTLPVRVQKTVQSNLLTDYIQQYREISVTTNNISVDVWSSVLTIRALPINDRIVVACTIISFGLHGYQLQKTSAILTKVREFQYLLIIVMLLCYYICECIKQKWKIWCTYLFLAMRG